jgi:phage tail P2-like protein
MSNATTSLLPPGSSQQMQAISAALAARIAGIDPRPIRQVTSPTECPAALLPWLAWAWVVEDWSPQWSESQRREAITASRQIHRIKGTPGAVAAAIAPFGVGAQIIEAHQQTPPGLPNTFSISLEISQTALYGIGWINLIQSINRTKRLSSHLTGVSMAFVSTLETKKAVRAIFIREITISKHMLTTSSANDLVLDGDWVLNGTQALDGSFNL